jgi:hypothetical protein
MYKWYEGKRRDFEQRRDGKTREMFLLSTEYFYEGEKLKVQ